MAGVGWRWKVWLPGRAGWSAELDGLAGPGWQALVTGLTGELSYRHFC